MLPVKAALPAVVLACRLSHCDKKQALNKAVLCLQPELHGMVPCHNREFEGLQQSAVYWPNSLKQCVAICNSLKRISKHHVIGDQADYTAFKACEACFLVRTYRIMLCAYQPTSCTP